MLDEVRRTNLQALMLANQLSNKEPAKALQMFGLDEQAVAFFKDITPTQIDRLANCGHSAFTFRFTGKSLEYIDAYLKGDDLAMTQAMLNISGRN